MDLLPSEIFAQVLQELSSLSSLSSLINLSLCCKRYYDLIQTNQLVWENFYNKQLYDPNYAYPRNYIKSSTDWKTVVRNIYCWKNNWKHGKATLSKVPGTSGRKEGKKPISMKSFITEGRGYQTSVFFFVMILFLIPIIIIIMKSSSKVPLFSLNKHSKLIFFSQTAISSTS